MSSPIRSWLLASCYNAGMHAVERRCLSAWRRELLSRLDGRVLEIGAGTGTNLAYYPTQLRQLVLAEPDPWMRRQLRRKLSASARIELVAAGAEALPCGDETCDAVVSTLVLCSVADLAGSLREVVRVLRPGGGLFFIEHVADQEHPGIARWQQRIEPLWRFCCGNCHLTRETGTAIEAAGLVMETLRCEVMLGAPQVARSTIRGIARKL